MAIILATVLALAVPPPTVTAGQAGVVPAPGVDVPVGGSVVDLDTGVPIAGAVVTLVGRTWPQRASLTERALRAETGPDGRYVFSAVPPDEYTLTVRHPEYAEAQVGWLNDPREQQTTGTARIDFRLQRAGTIGGRLTDAQGRPVVGARMIALPLEGRPIPFFPSFAPQTNQDGQYLIPSLPPGRYQVLAEWIDPTAASGGAPSAYQRSFFPGERNRAAAAIVSVEPGTSRRNIDFTLAPSDLLSMTGRVEPAAAAGALEGYLLWGTASIRTVKFDAEGNFSVRFLQPGRYTLVAHAVDRDRAQAASTPIDLSANVTNLVLTLQPTATLAGRVVAAGSGRVPEALQIAAVLSDAGSAVDPLTRDRAEVAPDGAFAVHRVFGERVLRIVGADPGWVIERVTRGGAPANAIRIQPSVDITDVVVVIARRP